MTPFTAPLVFMGGFLRMVLEMAGFKKVARKLDWLEDVLEEDYRRDDHQDSEPGWFGLALYKGGMVIVMVTIVVFTESYYAFFRIKEYWKNA